jgi:hypothetical protein
VPISDAGSVSRVLRKIEREAAAAVPLVRVAQRSCDVFFETFEHSVVLVRLFVTLLYGNLPAEERAFADGVARRKKVQPLVTPVTPVLTLLGTRGVNASWNDRCLSEGHRAIPLVSAALVESMPMTAKLFREIDPDLSWLADQDRGLVKKAWGAGPAGLFFVPDAASSQDFVRQYGVKTVLGIARSYGEKVLFAMLVFLRQPLTQEKAQEFLPIAAALRGVTLRAIGADRVFAGESSAAAAG